jgi:hypothetical protein
MENVISLFRPILKDLKVQYISGNPTVVKASDYRDLIVAGMSRCIIVARQTTFTDDTKGCLSFSYDKDHNIFLFVINVDHNFFDNDSEALRILRKTVAVHEFVHCTAAMLLLSRSRPDVFIQRTQRTISEKVTLTTSMGFTSLLEALGMVGSNSNIPKPELLTDEHFRISNEDEFIGHYGDLYINFLLSYQLLHETIMAAKIQHSNQNMQFVDLILIVHRELAEKKALDRNFVLGRIRTFLPNIVAEFT